VERLEISEELMERKLASIQKVTDIQPIPDRDFIVQAKVLGWPIITRKDEFEEGDLCVFFEIDSLLPPENQVFTFMDKYRYRVKTLKLRGVLSQGLALPLTSFDMHGFEEDDDVTKLLDIKKHNPKEPGGVAKMIGQMKCTRPFWIPKTDETRLQSRPGVLKEIEGTTVRITTKCDGSSFSAGYYAADDEFHVCSRNRSIKEADDSVWWKIAHRYQLREKLRIVHEQTGQSLCIQGEICGPSIQKNRMGLSDHTLLVFDVWSIDNQRYLDTEDQMNIINELGLLSVPIEGEFTIVYGTTLDEFLEWARGNYRYTDHPREGIVVRPLMEAYSPALKGRASFKVINNDFLLKIGE